MLKVLSQNGDRPSSIINSTNIMHAMHGDAKMNDAFCLGQNDALMMPLQSDANDAIAM
jgi:hypothetical protein